MSNEYARVIGRGGPVRELPRDAPVEPDFAAIVTAAGWSTPEPHLSKMERDLIRAAFAAGRQAAPQPTRERDWSGMTTRGITAEEWAAQAAPQPEGGISDRNSDGTPIDWKATWIAENWLREQDQARIAALEAALRDFAAALRWLDSQGGLGSNTHTSIRAILEQHAAALTPTSGAADGKGEEG